MDNPYIPDIIADQQSLLMDIANRGIIHLPSHASVGDAARIMSEKRISSMVVTNDGLHPLGIATESDILNAMQQGLDHEESLESIMSSPVVTVQQSMNLLDAYQLCLRRNIRHLLIVDEEGSMLGLVSETDFRLRMNLSVLAGHRLIASAMSRSVPGMSPHATLSEALNLMKLHRDSCVVVIENDRPVGILTERDVVRLYRMKPDLTLLAEVMTTPVMTVSISDSINDAAKLMLHAGIRHLVVVDETGKMAGLIGEHDLTQAMAIGLIEDKMASEGAFLGTLLNTIPDLAWLKDTGGIYRACNARFENYFGREERRIIGNSAYDFLDRETADLYCSRDRKAMESGMQVADEEWLTFAGDGYCGLFETVRTPMRDALGNLIGILGIAHDITRRKLTENALRESEELFSTIVNQAADSIVLIDCETLKFAQFNEAAHKSLGYTRKEFASLKVADIQAQLSEQEIRCRMKQSIEKEDVLLFETIHRRKDGSTRETRISSRPVAIKGKTYVSAIWSDISVRKRAEESLLLTASVFASSQEGIVITDAENRIIDVNPAFSGITGYGREEVLGRNPNFLKSGRHPATFYEGMWRALVNQGAWRGEIWNRKKSGEVYAELLSISVIRDEHGRAVRHVAVFSDISHLKEHEEELARIAHYDALTGIPNRVLLADRMKQAMAQTLREGDAMAICYLDLDGFKTVNDTLGHEAGDSVLVEVAGRIQGAIRAGDTVARLGGDEFVVLLLGLEKDGECVDTLERLLEVLALPFMFKGNSISLGASIGVSIYPLDDEAADTLLRHADQAMYVAKRAGKNRFHIYNTSLDQHARRRHELTKSVRQAIHHGQFELHYQPKIEMRTGRMVGAEALIRWQHPERGLLLPSEFMGIIENTDLEIAIGEWVIHEALEQSEKWRNSGLDIEVSVNISARHMESEDFAEKLKQKIAKQGPEGRLQVEVLETAALEDVANMSEIIRTCREFGVGFALDDFGTGYSSLSHLSSLPVNALKIDQTFVRNMLHDKGNMAIVQSIIALARAFERQIVAEGIETEDHFRTLFSLGCEMGQGFGIAKPMTAEELENWRFVQRVNPA